MALAVGLLIAIAASQLPEFVQQYRQRLGGAIDELNRVIARFDAEARADALDRSQAIARLEASPDGLVQAHGRDVEDDVSRERRLDAQQSGFENSGPIWRYWVFLERLDPALARETYDIYRPAVPVTVEGFAAAGVGLIIGWAGCHLLALPFRRRRIAAA